MRRLFSCVAGLAIVAACHVPSTHAEEVIRDGGVGHPAAPSAHAFEGYVAFSSDGLLLAYAEHVPSGVRLRWLSSTTNTIEKTSPIDTPKEREDALAELAEEGFPLPGVSSTIPSQVSAKLQKGRVVVYFGRMPASRPFKPFTDRIAVTPDGVSIAAVSPDGKFVAVRVTGHIGQAGTVSPEYRVVALFE